MEHGDDRSMVRTIYGQHGIATFTLSLVTYNFEFRRSKLDNMGNSRWHVTGLESMLGFIPGQEGRILRQALLDEIVPLTSEHKGLLRTIRLDHKLSSRINDIFRRHGPLIWPDEAEDRTSVLDAAVDNQDGLYPRNLYYTRPGDREK